MVLRKRLPSDIAYRDYRLELGTIGLQSYQKEVVLIPGGQTGSKWSSVAAREKNSM
jgi:hypothetical protein